MAVYTKVGDKGKTASMAGKQISKACLEVEIYGEIDELNSYIGLLRTDKLPKNTDSDLDIMQRQLFDVIKLFGTKTKTNISLADVAWLENQIDEIEDSLKPLKGFILPAGSKEAVHAHLARTVCRRAERAAVKLSEQQKINPLVLKYLNRLSDYFFVLARKLNKNKEILL